MTKVRKMNNNEIEMIAEAKKVLKEDDFFNSTIFMFIAGYAPRTSIKRCSEIVDMVREELIEEADRRNKEEYEAYQNGTLYIEEPVEKEEVEDMENNTMTIGNLVDEYNDITETLAELNAANDMNADSFSILQHDVRCFVDSILKKHRLPHVYDSKSVLHMDNEFKQMIMEQNDIEILVENLMMQADIQSRIIDDKNCNSRCYARAIESLLVYCGNADDVFVVVTDDNDCIDVIMRNGHIVFQREMECVYDMIQRYYDITATLNDLVNRGDLSNNVPGIQAYCVELKDEIRLDLRAGQWEMFLRHDSVEEIDQYDDCTFTLRAHLERLADLLSHPYNTGYVDDTYSLLHHISKDYGLSLTIKMTNEVRYAVDKYGKSWAVAY